MHKIRQQIEEMTNQINLNLHRIDSKTLSLIDALMAFSTKENDYFGISKAHLYLGIVDVEKGNVNDGISQYIMALSYTFYEGLEALRPPVLNNLGVAQNIIGNHVAAIEHLSNAKNIINRYQVRLDLLPIIHGNIADAYLGIHQPEKALEYLDKVNEGIALLDYDKAYLILANYAEAYLQLKSPEKAFNYILWCEEVLNNRKYFSYLSYVDYLKAKYFELLHAYEDVEIFYKKAIDNQIKDSQLFYYPKISSDYMSFLMDHQKYEACVPFIKRSLELAKINHWDFIYSEYYSYLSECYRALSEWELAFNAINLYFEHNNKNKERLNQYQLNLLNAQESLMRLEIKNNMLTQSIENMKVVNNILKKINAVHNLNDLVKDLYIELKNIFEIDTFTIGLLEAEERKITYIAKYENDVYLGTSQIDYDNDKSFSVWAKNNLMPVIIHNADDFDYIKTHYAAIKLSREDYIKKGNYSKSIVIWPLMIEDEMIGLINIQALKEHAYNTYDLELIEMLSAHLAIALINNKQRNELNHMIEKLNELSFIDSLTGIYNRQAFNEFLPSLYKEAIDLKQNLVFAMIDLDNFKALNDAFGHQEGDLCLQQFGDLLKDVVGNLGYSYRYGGDEFSVLFMGIELEVVDSILEEICQKSSKMYTLDPHLTVSASIGAVFIENGDCADLQMRSFISYADNALYIAKSEGKNTYRRVIV
ncbi:sensor domain-containing diguanylate cyclase [Fusibacter sp. 3D3]|uniref:sensor domain-containing diguanylate cyclase n=1 Tax=Fusibacter sp. 3D3 TaxID=1048380 RepID=UPI000852F2FA|nr:sensor domain-containing diguanylate cyclase [Fusibacter sp. 3D3]GAU77034.1 sensory box/GGDEF family protein [Fusibacter sp. 3D3]